MINVHWPNLSTTQRAVVSSLFNNTYLQGLLFNVVFGVSMSENIEPMLHYLKILHMEHCHGLKNLPGSKIRIIVSHAQAKKRIGQILLHLNFFTQSVGSRTCR
jgi:hypothetical protein